MNVALTDARRVAISPYARRLARERGISIRSLGGTGPDGRIVAADVLSFSLPAKPLPAPAMAPPVAAPVVVQTASFSASIALSALRDLLTALENAGKLFEIEDILLRAVGRAFPEVPKAAVGVGAPVAQELDGRQAVFATVPEMPLHAIRSRRLAALAGADDESAEPAILSVRVLGALDVRPAAMPLVSGRAMRLVVSCTSGDTLECLVTADVAVIDEMAVAAWLAALKSTIEQPLRLFV